ncbi:hypothetical protein DMENIID0001_156450 [Sergentomyia squamirostris]
MQREKGFVEILFPEGSEDEDNVDLDSVIDYGELSYFSKTFTRNTGSIYIFSIRKRCCDQETKEALKKESEVKFHWTKEFTPVERSESTYPFGRVNIEVVDEEFSPCAVFRQVVGFDKLSNIVCHKSQLYMWQKGIPFSMLQKEFSAFMGIVFFMGYHVLPNIRDYWSKQSDLRVDFVSSVMTRQRFENIRSALHFNDNSTADKNDRANKIRPIIEHLNKCFQEAREPTLQQSIDEHMVKFKGRNLMKQYIRNKPIKWGFKMWCRCDAATGYLFEFDIYQGKKALPEFGLGEGVVVTLCKSIENLGCEIYIDNFFNSPMLQHILLGKKIYSCGTVQSKRKNLPDLKDFKNDKAMKRGESEWRASGSISCVKWMDNKAVLMLSNFLSPEETVKVGRRQSGNSQKLSIDCPNMVKIYNTNMKGVDQMDQKKVYYEHDRKSATKFYLRLFFDLMDISLGNACVIYNQMAAERNIEKQLSTLEFRQEVVRSLIGEFRGRNRVAPKLTPKVLPSHLSASIDHCIIHDDKRRRCVQCYKSTEEDVKTNCKCETCGVHLCFTKARNCFQEYHTKKAKK